MNKKALVEFVRRSLLGREPSADDQKAYHFQRVSQGVSYAYDTILSQINLDDAGRSDIEEYFVKHYYKQPVSEANGYRYFGISDSIAPIDGGRGIWYVQPSGGGAPIPQSQRPSTSLFANMAVGECMNQTVWRLGNLTTNQQIIIENIGESPLEDIREVDYGIVRAFDSIGDEEEVKFPDGRYDLLIQMAREWLGGAFTTKANDNV